MTRSDRSDRPAAGAHATDPRPRRRGRWPLVLAAGVALAVVGAGGAAASYFLFRPAAPSAVGLSGGPTASPALPSSATPAASSSAAGAPALGSSGSPATAGELTGTWTVDPTIGSFDDFSSSFVGYRVEEELATVGAATAVGRTPDVTGSLVLDGTTITAVEMTADLTTLRSDDDRRDGQLRRQAIETGTYPTATFVLTSPIELGSVPAEGQVVSVTAAGDFTLHGQTRAVEIPLEARLAGGVVTVTGSLPIAFADYGIAKPQGMIVLSIADNGIMEFQLHFTRG